MLAPSEQVECRRRSAKCEVLSECHSQYMLVCQNGIILECMHTCTCVYWRAAHFSGFSPVNKCHPTVRNTFSSEHQGSLDLLKVN